MLVCHCEVVSDHAIRAAISAGAYDTATVGQLCGAGAHCWGCHPALEELLAEAAVAVASPAAVRARQADRRRGRTPVTVPVAASSSAA
jgi:bacterioferritin-associated ferredoxin